MEELLPRGATELTKQQIRYLLQVRPRPPEPAPRVTSASSSRPA